MGIHGPFISSASVLVLDDSCVAERDLSNHVMGNVKDVSSISNLRTLIMEEGFSVVNLVYLGGLWVMIECDNVETKANTTHRSQIMVPCPSKCCSRLPKEIPVVVNAKVMNNSQDVYKEASCDNVDPNVSRKWLLWDYVSTLIDRWNGEVVVLGDFNEVQNIDERRGSCFNPTSARVFDQFISASGLVVVKMEGYIFTWSYPSGSKMSKLDRFFVSEGIFSIFPSITAVCLDRHLSDHRPIILCEDLKVRIRAWIKDTRSSVSGEKDSIKKELSDIDRLLDGGDVSDSNLLRRSGLHRNLYNINQMESKEYLQKSKIKWAIEGDENSNFFHGLINKKRSQLAIRGVFVDGIWCTNPNKVKEDFFKHFEARFKKPVNHRLKINFLFSKRLSYVQASDLERRVSRDEIRLAVWNCGENKSPGPNGYSFEFFRKYWNLVGSDLYTQSAFVANRQILDGSFILNELLHWCKRKKKQVMFFKVDFNKAYDSARWDYLLDVLEAFGFSNIWCKWIRGTFSSAKASVLVSGSPTIEFPFHCWLKLGDPLSFYLFILIMESLNMSFTRAIDEGVFKASKENGGLGVSSYYALNRVPP
nr:RNA-directed DNA polymerase, eukaryota [Tanacetum cinerariifolium]